jgi:uncharacterized protein YukE
MSLWGDLEKVGSDIANTGLDLNRAGADTIGAVGNATQSLAGDLWSEAKGVGGAIDGSVHDLWGALKSGVDVLTDASLGSIRRQLEDLGTEVGHISQDVALACDAAHWTGQAASSFHSKARQRESDLRDLVKMLDAAADTAAAALAGTNLM